MMSEKTTVEKLYEQVKLMGAGEAHMELGGIKNDADATAVFSVYDGQRPSNKVLDDLYDWAEDNGKSEITDKIDELSKMEGSE